MLYYLCYMIAKKHGGKRPNSGRDKVTDPKIQVTTYHRQSAINKAGGMDKFKHKIYKAV